MSKRRWLAAGILSVLLALCVGLAAGNAAAVAAAGDTDKQIENDALSSATEEASQADNWEPNAEVQTTGEGEDALYTVSSNATGVVEYRAGSHYLDVVSDYDTMQADFKYSGSAESNMEYVGIQLNSGNDYYLFTVWPNTAAPGSPPVAFVQKNTEDPISRWVRVELDPAEFGKDTWFTMKVTLCNNYFSFLLNGETIATAQTAGQDVGNISWTRALAVTKGTPAQINTLVLSSEMPDSVAQFDLEFSLGRGRYEGGTIRRKCHHCFTRDRCGTWKQVQRAFKRAQYVCGAHEE